MESGDDAIFVRASLNLRRRGGELECNRGTVVETLQEN